MHSDSKKRRSSCLVALLFTAGELGRSPDAARPGSVAASFSEFSSLSSGRADARRRTAISSRRPLGTQACLRAAARGHVMVNLKYESNDIL